MSKEHSPIEDSPVQERSPVQELDVRVHVRPNQIEDHPMPAAPRPQQSRAVPAKSLTLRAMSARRLSGDNKKESASKKKPEKSRGDSFVNTAVSSSMIVLQSSVPEKEKTSKNFSSLPFFKTESEKDPFQMLIDDLEQTAKAEPHHDTIEDMRIFLNSLDLPTKERPHSVHIKRPVFPNALTVNNNNNNTAFLVHQGTTQKNDDPKSKLVQSLEIQCQQLTNQISQQETQIQQLLEMRKELEKNLQEEIKVKTSLQKNIRDLETENTLFKYQQNDTNPKTLSESHMLEMEKCQKEAKAKIQELEQQVLHLNNQLQTQQTDFEHQNKKTTFLHNQEIEKIKQSSIEIQSPEDLAKEFAGYARNILTTIEQPNSQKIDLLAFYQEVSKSVTCLQKSPHLSHSQSQISFCLVLFITSTSQWIFLQNKL